MKQFIYLLFFTLFCGGVNADYRNGIVAYYAFDGIGPSNITRDSSGNNHCEVFGASFNGWSNRDYYFFDGQDDYMDCGNDPSLNIADEFTISAWIRAYDLKAATILTKESADHSIRNYNIEVHSPDGEIKFVHKNAISNDYTNIISKPRVILPNEWVYFVTTKKNKDLNFYVLSDDGYDNETFFVEKITEENLNLATDSNSHLLIGKSVFSGFEFFGDIDNLAIHNRALSIGEIQKMYQDEKNKVSSQYVRRAIIFADELIAFNSNYTDSSAPHLSQTPYVAIGLPYYEFNRTKNVYIDVEGEIVLKFIDNALTTSKNSDLDLIIYSTENYENIEVSISKDGNNWVNIGSLSTRSTDDGELADPFGRDLGRMDYGIDIDAYIGKGILLGERYHYVRITSNNGTISFDAIGTNPKNKNSERPHVFSESLSIGEVSPRLDIIVPSLNYEQFPNSFLNIWAGFEYYGTGSQGESLWKLNSYGENK